MSETENLGLTAGVLPVPQPRRPENRGHADWSFMACNALQGAAANKRLGTKCAKPGVVVTR